MNEEYRLAFMLYQLIDTDYTQWDDNIEFYDTEIKKLMSCDEEQQNYLFEQAKEKILSTNIRDRIAAKLLDNLWTKRNEKITDFYWFNTEETYYSLAGITTEGQQMYAIVSPDKKEVTVLQQDAVINEQEARSITKQAKNTDEILEARLGMIKDEPVWEVNYRTKNQRIGYYYISAKNGQWIKDIENI